MHLKRLELSGFKSFAQKTVLEFPGSITAVVGPNGSGKSNMIDAFRWLLGEREAKQMRGARAEDLIFAGTARAAPMSLAQAALVFDNSDRFFPVDYTEIVIRRKIGRDGISEYFLNDAAVRLKDILDFFAKSRLGTKGFSIVNQGESDLFVRADPKDRRAMLEEILGLKQFQIKKHDAELKLNATHINLEKVHALLDEMAPHVRLLRRQTSRWEKHAEFKQELEALEAHYFNAKLYELETENAKTAPELASLEKSVEAKRRELEKEKGTLRAVEASQPRETTGFSDIEKRRAELETRKAHAERELGRIEAQIEFMAERAETPQDAEELSHFLHELKGNLQELADSDDLEEMKSVLAQVVMDIEGLLESDSKEETTEAADKLKESKEKLTDEMREIEEELNTLADSHRAVAGQFAEFNERFKKAYDAVEVKRNELASLETKRNRFMLDGERITMRWEELAREAKEAGYAIAEIKPRLPETGSDTAATARRMFKLRGELASIGEVDHALIKEAEEAEKRYVFLKSQVEDLERATKDLKALIKELDQKIHTQFNEALASINGAFEEYFKTMFGGGRAHLRLMKQELRSKNNELENGTVGEEDIKEHEADYGGIEIEVAIPRKKIHGLDMLSGGERSLVSIAALFALISVSPPPFIVLDEIDAALDDANTRRFAELVTTFSGKTQFVIVTHNRATMEAANVLYGVTMKEDGTSRVLSLKLE